MNTQTQVQEHTIDATGRKLGRLASEVATILMGKHRTDFARHTVAPVKVEIVNASKMDITEKKLDQKEYKRYSGFPGGLKSATARQVVEKHGYGSLILRAVEGMLPKNRLQKRVMKNIKVSE